jgi:hypothetical protein
MPLRSLFRRLIRRPLGLPLFEMLTVGLILVGLLVALILPFIHWVRTLIK